MNIVRKLVFISIIAVVCMIFAETGIAQEKQDGSEPKVKKVVLYKHGVGYFELKGKVQGDATVSLHFKTEQMKDLLTSLYAIDIGGKVVSIGYDTKDPVEKQLENILIRVPEANALTQFLMQLKGAKIEVKIGNETTRGNILGVEPIVEKKGDSTITNYKLVLLREDGQIQPINLFEVASFKLLDEAIQKDLQRVMDIYLSSKYTDRKRVNIAFKGKGEREVRIGYLIEAPIWKTSYRLLLGDKPMLQGWAIVENPTDTDWEDVNVSLVAGNPISFIMDLYTPYYPARPLIQLSSLIPGTMPVSGLLAKGKVYADEGESRRFQRAQKSEEDSKNYYGASAPPMEPSLTDLLTASFESIAQGAAVGELFSYDVSTPVSIQAGKAALLPIISDSVEGDKILYYNTNVSLSPMNAFYFKNTASCTIETGPVTFFEGSTSVGEGLFKKPLKPGMKEILPYAVEQGCTINIVSPGPVAAPGHSATVVNGILSVKRFNSFKTIYKINNQTSKGYELYLDHLKNANELLIPEKPEEELPGIYRFKISILPNQTTEFNIVEREEIMTRVYVRGMSFEEVRYYIEQQYISKEAKAFLSQMAAIMQEKARISRQIQDAASKTADFISDEDRCRKNLDTLRETRTPKEVEMRQAFLERLDSAEKSISELRTLINSLREDEKKIEQQLTKMIHEYKE
ncbi:MAG: hypothetical protein ABIH42_00295 [Planctomycetota bacterium]